MSPDRLRVDEDASAASGPNAYPNLSRSVGVSVRQCRIIRDEYGQLAFRVHPQGAISLDVCDA